MNNFLRYSLVALLAIATAKLSAQASVAPSTSGGQSDPILTLKGTVGEEVTLAFGVYETEDEFSVDFGDGNLQTAKVGIDNKGPVQEDGTTPTATTFKGTVAGDGTIKVYGNNDIWYFVSSGAMPTTLDQAKLMNVVQMTITGVNVESVVLPAYEKMTHFSFNNSPVKAVDVSKVATLTNLTVNTTTLSAYEPQLESIDVSKNTELNYLSIQGADGKQGKLTSADLSKNIKLTNIFLQYNKLSQVTLPSEYTILNNSGVPAKITLSLNNNELTELKDLDKIPAKSLVYIQNNKFTLATLPAKTSNLKTYTYAPQAAYEVAETLSELDLSSQLTATGVLTEPATTIYSFVTAGGTALVEDTDYEVTAPGLFKFLTEQTEKVHGVMETAAFPNFTGANAFVTTEFTVSTAQQPALLLTLTGTVGEEVSLTFGVYDTEDTFSVDFGDGTLQTEKVGIDNKGPVQEDGTTPTATTFKGTVAGDGTIKVYGNNDIWYFVSSGAMPTTLDQAKLMNVVQMTITGVNVESVVLPAYEKMTHFSFNNSPVKAVDVSKVATLTNLTVNTTTLSAYEPQLESIDVSKNTELNYLSIQGADGKQGKLTSADLSKNIKLTNIFLQYNKLSQVTLPSEYTILNNSGVPAKITLSLNNNELTELKDLDKIPAKSLVYIQNNKFTLATLPAKTSNLKTYTYAPQAAYEVAETLSELDLSSQLTATGVLTEPATTIYSFVTAGGTALVEDTDYEVTAPGLFKFLTEQTEKVHGVMETAAFPNFTGANAFVTTEFTVSTAQQPALILTLTGTVGEEVSLKFGVYDTEDTFSIDFGDGTLQTAKVGINNAGPKQEDGQAGPITVFTGTIAGDGTIKVYGNNDIWYYNTTGNVLPTAFDQAKLMNVVQMSISGANVESVAIPESFTKIQQFSFNNSPVKNVDVSKATTLTNLEVVYSSLYTGEMNLEAIDVKNNTELTKISIQSQATGVNTKLKEIDLSKNTKLTDIYLSNNSLANVTLPTEFTTKDANDPTVKAKVSLFLSNNKLTAIDGLDELPAKSTANISNNLFTLATLPVKPANVSTSKYTYAPQSAYEVAESVAELDLSSQLTAKGVAEEEQTTIYSFVTAGGTALVEGTDYEVTAPGQFKFLTEQAEKVHGVMATAAFPKFTGTNAYVTTEFAIDLTTVITNVHAAKKQDGKYFNLQGVEVRTPSKGLYIVNGKKVVIK